MSREVGRCMLVVVLERRLGVAFLKQPDRHPRLCETASMSGVCPRMEDFPSMKEPRRAAAVDVGIARLRCLGSRLQGSSSLSVRRGRGQVMRPAVAPGGLALWRRSNRAEELGQLGVEAVCRLVLDPMAGLQSDVVD